MSWIAEYDTQGREFPTCVHVTKTTGSMTHGATYVPIEDGKTVRIENAKLRELVRGLRYCAHEAHGMCARVPVGGERPFTCCPLYDFDAKEYQCEKLMRELGMEVK